MKTKMFDFEACVLIGWLANTNQSECVPQSQTILFLCYSGHWPAFLTLGIVSNRMTKFKGIVIIMK